MVGWDFGVSSLVAPIAGVRVECAHSTQFLEPGGIGAAAAVAATLSGQRIVGLIVQTHLVWLLLLLLLWILIAQLQNLQTKRVRLTIVVASLLLLLWLLLLSLLLLL